jgi:hypothetical protein
MTWKLIVRGSPHRTIVAEYECPLHGRFEATVDRTVDGDAPDLAVCPHVQEVVDAGGGYLFEIECLKPSPWRISAPISRVKMGDVVKGKDPGPQHGDRNLMNTRPLADGTMTMAEFKAHRAQVHRDISLDRVRKLRSR